MSTTKSVKLQLNAKGAWKDVCRFDIVDAQATAHIMEAAATIATYATDKPSARIVTADAHSLPLMHWDSDKGWKPWGNAL